MFGGDSARFFLFYSYLLPFSSASYFSLSAFSQSTYLSFPFSLFLPPPPLFLPSPSLHPIPFVIVYRTLLFLSPLLLGLNLPCGEKAID